MQNTIQNLVQLGKPAISWVVRRGLVIASGLLGAGALELEEPFVKGLMGLLSLVALAAGECLMRKHTGAAVKDATEMSINQF